MDLFCLSHNLIVARPDRIFKITCVYLFSVLLSHHFAILVFFVTEDIVVRWDRGRVGHHHCCGLFAPLICTGTRAFQFPLLSVMVLAGSRHAKLLWIDKSIIESFDLGCKSVVWFDQLYAELIKAKFLESFGTLHSSVNLVKTVCICV